MNDTAIALSPSARRLIISTRCAGSMYTQRRNLILAAQRAGWSVVTLGNRTDDGYPSRLTSAGIPFEHVPTLANSASLLVRLFAAYRSAFSKYRPLIFHAFTVKPIVAGLMAARLAQIPVRVATFTGLGHTFQSSSRPTQWILEALLKFALRGAHAVLFYNEDDRLFFISRGLVTADKTYVVHGSGVDTQHFAPVYDKVESRPSRILYIGRVIREKGAVELLEAARILKERNASVQVEIVGDIDPANPSSLTRSELQSAVDSGFIVWHGHVEDVRPLIASSDAVVLASHREGIPLALLEGAAMGKPLIATSVPGCRDVVRHRETGILVPPSNPTALADAMEELGNDRERAAIMGRNARALIEASYSSDAVTAKVLEIYERLALRNGHLPS